METRFVEVSTVSEHSIHTPLSQGKPIEWKLIPKVSCFIKRSPLSQGKPIEWKQAVAPTAEAVAPTAEAPLSQGKPIEWKQKPSLG